MRFRFLVFLMLALILVLIAGCNQGQRHEERFEQGANRVQISSQQKQMIEELNRKAEIVFQYVREDNPEQARVELHELGQLVSQMSFHGITNVEGIEALTHSIVEGKESLNAVQYEPQKSMYAAIQIRLAVDALKKSRNAMWLQYEKVFSEDVKRMRAAIDGNEREAMVSSFEQTKLHLSLIRPSLFIRREPAQVEAIDSLMQAMEQRIQQEQNLESIRPLIEHYATLMHEIFHEESDETFVTIEDVKARPLLWSTIIGSLIISVLSYVAYRRYRYERDHFVVVDRKKEKSKEDEV